MSQDETTAVESCRPLMSGITVKVQVLHTADVTAISRLKVMECLVGDETASILMKVKGKECAEMRVGRSLKITDCKVEMYYGSMRLACEQQKSTFEEIEPLSSIKKDVNMSLLEFESIVVDKYLPAEEPGDLGNLEEDLGPNGLDGLIDPVHTGMGDVAGMGDGAGTGDVVGDVGDGVADVGDLAKDGHKDDVQAVAPEFNGFSPGAEPMS